MFLKCLKRIFGVFGCISALISLDLAPLSLRKIALKCSQIRSKLHLPAFRNTLYAAEIIFGLMLLIVSFSYVLEFTEETFTSFWDGLWYCFAVVTTIGFGDLTPTTEVGRLLSVILGLYGIVVVALITSIIVNFYGEMKKESAKQTVEPESGEDGGPPC